MEIQTGAYPDIWTSVKISGDSYLLKISETTVRIRFDGKDNINKCLADALSAQEN